MLAPYWYFLFICFAAWACGESGSPEGPLGPSQQEQEVVEDVEDSPSFQFTQLPSHFFSFQAPEGLACLSQHVGSTLAQEPGFFIDREIVKEGSYIQSAALLTASQDRSLHLWVAAGNLHFLARTPVKEPLALEMDLFGLVRSADKLRIELRKQVQFSELGAFGNEDGQAIPTLFGKVQKHILDGSEIYHFEIPLRKIGDVLFWPNFMVRVRSHSQARDIATRNYEGILAASDGGMTVAQCADWRQHPGNATTHGLIAKSEGMSERGTRALNIAREAISESLRLFGRLAAKRDIPFVVSDEPWETTPQQILGSLGVALQSDRLMPFYSQDDGNLSVYVQALLGFWLHQLYGVWPAAAAHELTQQSLSLAVSFVQIEKSFGRIQSLIWYHHLALEKNLAPIAVLYGWALAQLPLDTLKQDLEELTTIMALDPSPDLRLHELLGDRFPRLLELAQRSGSPSSPLQSSDLLADGDQDGLSDVLEAVTNSDPQQIDTDGDSWNDYSEYLAGSDMLSALIKANALIQDGSLRDWFELMPNKIAKKELQTGECPSGAQLGWYGAVAEERRVLLAGNALNRPDLGNLVWIVKILIPETQSNFSLRVDSSKPQVVMTAKIGKSADAEAREQTKQSHQGRVLGADAFEMVFDGGSFGLENINFAQPGLATVQIQLIEMVEGQEVLCDTTNEFSPVISSP